jgi:hypothetical protein
MNDSFDTNYCMTGGQTDEWTGQQTDDILTVTNQRKNRIRAATLLKQVITSSRRRRDNRINALRLRYSQESDIVKSQVQTF